MHLVGGLQQVISGCCIGMNVMLQAYHVIKSSLSNPRNQMPQGSYVTNYTMHLLFSEQLTHLTQQVVSSFLAVHINATVRWQLTQVLHNVLPLLIHAILNNTHSIGAKGGS